MNVVPIWVTAWCIVGLLWSLVCLLGVLVAAAPADAAEPRLNPTEVAQEAFELSTGACADRALRGTTARLDARAQVAPALLRVSRAWDQNHLPYLIYWRGVLGACVGEASAQKDLGTFLRLSLGDPGSTVLRADAKRRIRRMTGAQPSKPSPASVIVMIAGGAVAGVGGVLAAQARQEGQTLLESMGTLDGWATHHTTYESAQTRQRVGVAVLSGGSGVLVFGAITLPLGRRGR